MTETTASYIDTLKEIQACLLDEELFEQALALCDKLLNDAEDDVPPSTLVPILQETRLKLLLHLERFQQLLEDPNLSSSLESYVKYRLQQYHETSSDVDDTDVLSRHVQAQSLYRLHKESALEIYQQLLSLTDDDEEALQIQTNALAVAAAHAVPYCPFTNNVLDEASLETSMLGESNSDYLYNRATYDLLTGNNSRFMLQEARRVCQDDEDEAAAIDVQLEEWSLLWNGLVPEQLVKNKELPLNVKAVCDVNRAKSIASLPIKCPSNWTALQQRLYMYKRAILQLQARQYKECGETCQLFLKSLTQTKKNAPPPVHTKEQELWWTSRIHVVQAHALHQQQNKTQEAMELLRKSLAKLESTESTPAIDHAMAYTMLHLNELESNGSESYPQNTVDMLERLPPSIRSSQAVTSTLVALYQELGNVERATELLQDGGGMAEYYMSTGNYPEAARLYESTPGNETELVVALSHVDPIRARQVWNDLNIPKDDLPQELNGEELENMHLPRFKSKKTAIMPNISNKGAKEKRSHESILRARARKREEYLKNHPNAKKVDPERWLPKHERSYYRKRLGRNARGAQGGGTSNKEAAKLDVAARASGQAVDTGPSTAHIDVSSGSGKRSGRRR